MNSAENLFYDFIINTIANKNIIEESMIIESKLHKYDILKIKNLIGNRGIINDEEFKKLVT